MRKLSYKKNVITFLKTKTVTWNEASFHSNSIERYFNVVVFFFVVVVNKIHFSVELEREAMCKAMNISQ